MHVQASRKWITGGSLLLIAALMSHAALATNFEICVQSDADLANALDVARTTPVTARIVQHKLTAQNKAYDLKNTVWHVVVFTFGIQKGSQLLGGYTAGCSSRDIAVGNTLITDTGTSPFDAVLPKGDLTVEGLTFTIPGGLKVGLGSGSYFNVPAGSTILFRRDAFVNGDANNLFIDWDQGADSGDTSIRVVDSLFANNSNLVFSCAVLLLADSGAPEFDLINNTLAGNSGLDASAACFENSASGNATFRAYNNIFYGTTGSGASDLYTNTDQVVQVDNMIGSRSGPAAIFSSGNLSSDPNLDANYVPLVPSPAINSGSNSVPGSLPSSDLDGGPRIVGGIVDRGAYETTIDPHPKQTVTKHGVDNGSVGTLSAAVASVVNNGGGTIEFNITDGGSCPWVITEGSELDVNVTATINGYSQTGASVNDLDTGDDAVLCVIVEAASGMSAPTRGLVVQNTVADSVSVTIRGLGISGFSTAGIDLQGGSGHSIVGNHFGGSIGGHAMQPNGVDIRLGANANTTHDDTIGSSDIADRNIIGDAINSGIVINSGSKGNQVIGNYIGVGWAAGSSTFTNRGNGARGVYVAGDNNTISGNLIGYNAQSGIVFDSGGAHDNLISQNFIGTDPTGLANLGNTDRGIHLIGDSGGFGDAPIDNTIRFNTIASNGSQGVLIDVGQGNRVRKNSIYGNAQLGIDLGAAGVLANNDDGGIHILDEANRGQNYPVLTGAHGGFDSGYVDGSLTTTGGDYTIDFYNAGGCDPSGNGEGKSWLGGVSVTVPTPMFGNQSTLNFSLPIASSSPLFGGSKITATATDASGNTSEFSACQNYTNDDIFANGFEPPPV